MNRDKTALPSRKDMIKACIRISLAFALPVSAGLTLYFSRFTSFILDDTASGGFSAPEYLLFLTYVFFMLHAAVSAVLMTGALFRGLLRALRRAAPIASSPPAFITVCAWLSAMALAASFMISAAGFQAENRPFREYRAHLLQSRRQSSAARDMNVMLIVCDALRPDRLGCYGYGKKTSPSLDHLAREGVLFKSCYAQAPWTKPSVASLLSSLYPAVHGVNRWESVVPDAVTTLPEIMRKAGFITYGCVANPCLKAVFNYRQGFDYFDDYLMQDRIYFLALRLIREHLPFIRTACMRKFNFMAHDNIGALNKRLIPWIAKNRDRNFFVYAHYIDTHFYDSLLSREKSDEKVLYSRAVLNSALYDEKVGFADKHLGELFRVLKSLGIYDKTLIVVTADHGEAFGEHGNYYGGQTLYEEEIRVPLIMKYAPLLPAGKAVEEPVMSIDIMPAVLEAAAVPVPVFLDGKSVLPLLRGERGVFHEYIVSDNDIMRAVIKNTGPDKWKYIVTEEMSDEQKAEFSRSLNVPRSVIAGKGSRELYNLSGDRAERENRIDGEPGLSRVFQMHLDDYKMRSSSKRLPFIRGGFDADTAFQMKRMGYF